MQTIEQFLAHWCDPDLSQVQRVVCEAMLKQNRVIGVARAIGGVDYFPLISFRARPPNVIDRAGYYQLASNEGVRIFGADFLASEDLAQPLGSSTRT